MKKTISLVTVIMLMIVAYSCKKNTDSVTPSTVSLDLPATPDLFYKSNTAFKADSLNKVATLGRVLFYDAHLSVNNAISCGSCHKQALGFADNVALSTGFEGKLTKRNSIGINTLGLAGSLFWDGRETSVSGLALRPITNHVEMGIEDANALAQKLAALAYYSKLFTDAYKDANVTSDRIAAAIGTFMQSITAANTRFNEFQNGKTTSMSSLELEGMNLFDTKYHCGTCHNGGGGYYGGGSFKDIGLEKDYIDKGRGALTGMPTDNGTFRVPNLRNVALTAPYMHDGRYKTLSDVIDHYSRNIEDSPNLDTLMKDNTGHARSMNITDHEKAAIIAFLGTLTDYQMITDPKFSNPFKVN